MTPFELLNLQTQKILTDILSLLITEYGIKVSEETIRARINEKNISEIISLDNWQYQEKIKQITKTIANDLDNTMKDLAVTLGLAKIKNIINSRNEPDNVYLKKIKLILNNQESYKFLTELFKRKSTANQQYVMACIYDLFQLGNLDYPLPDGRTDCRDLHLPPNTLKQYGCTDNDIFLLQIFKSPLELLEPLLLNTKQPTIEKLMTDLRDTLLSEHIVFSFKIRGFMRDCYQEILYQLDILEQNKIGSLVENVPKIDSSNISNLRLTENATHFSHYITYHNRSHKLYYRYLRRLQYVNTNSSQTNSDLKKCLVSDTVLLLNNVKGVTFTTRQQILQAQKSQDKFLLQKLNEIIQENNISQLRKFIWAYAESNNIVFKKLALDSELNFICELFKTDPSNIAKINKNNPDLADYGVHFNLSDVCHALSQEDKWLEFLWNLLDLHRLPNALLKLIFNIGGPLFLTSQPDSMKPANPNKSMLNITQALRNEHSIYSSAINLQTISQRTTLGMQLFNIKFMSPEQIRERLEILIAAGCSMNDHLTTSNTMAHTFIVYEREDLIHTLLDFNDKLPVEKKINLNIINNEQNSAFPDGRSPLHLAVQTFASLTIIDRLLKNGAHPNIQDIYGATPLHYAVLLGRIDIIVRLVDAEAALSITDNKGNKPLDYLHDANIMNAFNFYLKTSAAVIKKIGYLTSMKYEQRSVGAKQNYLLVSPLTHEYFWRENTSGMAGDMDKKLMFPTTRNLYFDAELAETSTQKELRQKMRDYECTQLEITFIDKQIHDLDEEILFELICAERKRLQEFYKVTDNDTSKLINLLKQEYLLHSQINDQLKQLKVKDNNPIHLKYNESIHITLVRIKGKYRMNVKIIAKNDVNIDRLNGFCQKLHAFNENGDIIFTDISLSKIYHICGVVILSCKRNNHFISEKLLEVSAHEIILSPTENPISVDMRTPNLSGLDSDDKYDNFISSFSKTLTQSNANNKSLASSDPSLSKAGPPLTEPNTSVSDKRVYTP